MKDQINSQMNQSTKTKHAKTINDLSNEIISNIFDNLTYSDLFNMKTVCKNWLTVLKTKMHLKFLILYSTAFPTDRFWFGRTTNLFESQSLRFHNYSLLERPLFKQSFKNLKKLKIFGSTHFKTDLNLNSLNDFDRIVHLEIQMIEKCTGTLILNNLKVLCIDFIDHHCNRLNLNLPSLTTFKTNCSLNRFDFHKSPKLIWLQIHLFDSDEIIKFVDLQYLYCRLIKDFKFLEKLTSLRQIVFYGPRTNQIDQEKLRSSKDLKIYFFDFHSTLTDALQAVKSMNPLSNDPTVHSFITRIMSSQFNNLPDYLPFVYQMTYTYETIRLDGEIDKIPHDFFTKFDSIEQIFLSEPLQSDERQKIFFNFLKSLRRLSELNLDLTETPIYHKFFKRLIFACPKLVRIIFVDLKATCFSTNFLFSLKNLNYIKIDTSNAPISTDTAFIIKLFQELKFLNKIQFSHDGHHIMVDRQTNGLYKKITHEKVEDNLSLDALTMSINESKEFISKLRIRSSF